MSAPASMQLGTMRPPSPYLLRIFQRMWRRVERRQAEREAAAWLDVGGEA